MIDRRNLLVLAAMSAGSAAASGGSGGSGGTGGGASPPPPPRPTAVDEVKARLRVQQEAWNRGDLVSFCADYADDAVFLSPSGLTRGRAEVLARYTKKYGSARATMGKLDFEFLDERTSSELVTLALRWMLTWPDKPEAAGLTLISWQKIKGDWKLVQDASM